MCSAGTCGDENILCMPSLVRHHRLLSVTLLVTVIALAFSPHATAAPADAPRALEEFDRDWSWPLLGTRVVVEPFRAPAHAYGPGHRGIDIAPSTDAAVHAPADGVVAFRGVVVDRAVLTIDHGDGLVSSFEPVLSAVNAGTVVSEGELLGTIDVGGHAAAGTLHVGVRSDGVYVNPMLLFGGVPRAILLPCGPGGC